MKIKFCIFLDKSEKVLKSNSQPYKKKKNIFQFPK